MIKKKWPQQQKDGHCNLYTQPTKWLVEQKTRKKLGSTDKW